MPGAFASLDTGFPNLSGNGSTDDKLRAIQDYLYQLLEQLRYSMNNLGAENFNENSLKEITDKITEPIKAEIVDVERGLTTLIEITAEGVRLDVRRDYAAEWTSANNQKYYVGDVVKVTASDNSVKFYKCTQNHTAAAGNKPPSAYWTQIAAADVAYSRFDMNADAIRTEVTRATDAEGDLSTSITETAKDITLAAQRTYAPLWAAGTYYKGNIVRKETTVGDTVTVKYYKCTAESTSAEPPATGWTEIQAPDVLNSRFTVTADAISTLVTKTGINSLGAQDTLYSKITQNADAITTEVGKSGTGSLGTGETLYSRIDQTAGQIKSTVASATKQYDETKLPSGVLISVYGYGAPSGAAASGTVYLDQNTGYYYTSNGSTWTKSSSALPLITATLSSEITQLPDEIMLDVRKDYADAWRGGNVVTYHTNDIVRIVSDDSITFYKCLADHQGNSGNRPGTSGGAYYWTEITQPNVQSMIDLNLNGVSISYDSGQSGANTPFITLNKDGTTIGGGPVYIGELDADTITTGTLDASEVSFRDLFTCKIHTTEDDSDHTCGNIGSAKIKHFTEWASGVSYPASQIVSVTTTSGGNTTVAFYKSLQTHSSSNSNKPPNSTYWSSASVEDAYIFGIRLYKGNSNKNQDILLQEDSMTIGAYKKQSGKENYSHINLSPDSIKIEAEKGTTPKGDVYILLENGDITIHKAIYSGGTLTWKSFSLFDLEARVSALEGN